jgi:hypothetical protein
MHLAGLSVTNSSVKLPPRTKDALFWPFSFFYFGEFYPSTVRTGLSFFHPFISGANLQHSDKLKVGSNENDGQTLSLLLKGRSSAIFLEMIAIDFS